MAPTRPYNFRRRKMNNSISLEVNRYLQNINGVSRSVGDNRAFNKDYVEVITKPFKVFKLKKFFSFGGKTIENEVMNIDYTFKYTDLYSIYQSDDFSLFPPDSKIHGIREFFDTKVRRIVEGLFRQELDGPISISASKYEETCHLLCHDDKVDDRDIAFIYYANQKWDYNDGGLLDLFGRDRYLQPSEVVTSICPSFNSFVCFKVTPTSYHQVSEVVAALPKARYAISGWFHSTKVKNGSINLERLLLRAGHMHTRLPMMSNINYNLNDIVYPNEALYLSKAAIHSMSYSTEGFVALQFFLKLEFYRDLAFELNDFFNWVQRGPPNFRSVELIELTRGDDDNIQFLCQCPTVTAFVDVLQSSVFVSFLGGLSGYTLRNGEYTCEIQLEVNRWSWKTYTLSHNLSNALYGHPEHGCIRFELWFFFNCNLLNEDGSTAVINNFLDEERYILPVDNSLIIFKSSWEDEPRSERQYLKYVNHKMEDSSFHSIRVWYDIMCNPSLAVERAVED